MLRRVKQITIGITLLLFFASSSLGSLDQSSVNSDAGSQTSLSVSDNDFSPENSVKRRELKRSPRSRSEDEFASESAVFRRSLKRSPRSKPPRSSLPAPDKPARATPLIVRVRVSFISNSSNSRVYQQINVYRI